MRFAFGIPSWLGALLVVGAPSAVAGAAMAAAENYVAWWLALLIGVVVLVLSGSVWLAFWTWLENRRDAKRQSCEEDDN